ncbi:hypothetical protein ABT097_02670 [Streptomyces sp. NPDC002225]|uniref:hypothetical protein n=1 Tax=Streptomyces sp. NPDC002225 TaxID=3154413 RepID=UPI00332D60B8
MERTQPRPEHTERGEKSTTEAFYEAMWGSPIPFAVLSVLLYVKADNDDWPFGRQAAWWLGLGGWVPLVLMGVWAVAGRKKPKRSTAVASAVLLVAACALQFALNGSAAPWR